MLMLLQGCWSSPGQGQGACQGSHSNIGRGEHAWSLSLRESNAMLASAHFCSKWALHPHVCITYTVCCFLQVKAAERQRQASAGLDMFRPSRAGAATGTAPVPYNAAPAAALAMRATPPSGQRPAQQPGPATSGAVPGPKATQRTSTGVFDLSSPRSSGAAGPSEQHGSRCRSADPSAFHNSS